MDYNELHKAMALSLIPGVGPVKLNKWIKKIGLASDVYKEIESNLKKKSLSTKLQVNKKKLDHFLNLAALEIEKNIHLKREILYRYDDNFPPYLKHCPDSPVILFYKGAKIPSNACWLSVVGTRNVDTQSKILCDKILSEWFNYNPIVVSGLAYGIDAYTHLGAIDKGLFTIGVLGHGLDYIYPRRNQFIADKMMTYGGLITEFWSTIKPEKSHFIMRNRIIAGLSPQLVVVQAGKKSGALSSAFFSHQYNRDVYAVPGRLEDPSHEGCHYLIATLKAQIYHYSSLNSSQMVLYPKKQKEKEIKIHFENESEEKIYTLIKSDSNLEIEDMIRVLSIKLPTLMNALYELELKKYIEPITGKKYKACL